MNGLLKEQELAAVMVIAYIMGKGDVFRSHHYTPLYWSSFVRYLIQNHGQIDEGRR
jgi:hypothetical protein